MGLTINFPTAGILSPPLIQTNGIAEDTTLESNRVYIANPATPITVTLPATPDDGDTIILKNITTPNVLVTIASARIEGVDQMIELTDNTAVRLIWTTAAFNSSNFGWLLA